MRSFEPQYLAKVKIPNSIIVAIRRIGEYKGKQDLFKKQAPEVLENLRQVAVIQSATSSNRLEGITAAQTRIKALVAEKIQPKDRSEMEIAGYRDVLNTIHSNSEGIRLTPNVILQLHRDLMKYSGKEGGRWKSVANEITEKHSNGSTHVRFNPPPPERVPELMANLQELSDQAVRDHALDPLLAMPLYILDFLCVHPFLDGNGRMARLLLLLMLYQHGYEVGRYISLERIVEKTKDSYYDTLYVSSQGWHEGNHDVIPWMEYLLSTILAAYHEFEERVGLVTTMPGSKAHVVTQAINGLTGDFTIGDILRICPTVSQDWIRKILRELKEQGKLEAIGKGRYARWRKI